MKNLFKSKLFITILVIVLGIFAYSFSKNLIAEKLDADIITAERMTLKEEVDVSGRVVPAQDVKLAFEVSGKVSSVRKQVGDSVNAGETVVQLNTSSIQANVEEARAVLRSEQAKLDQLLVGTREEEIEIKREGVRSAQISLEEADKSALDEVIGSYTSADDAVRNKSDQLFDNPRSTNPKLKHPIAASQLRAEVEQLRKELEPMLNEWVLDLPDIEDYQNVDQYIDEAKVILQKVKIFLDKMALVVNNLNPSSTLTATTISGYRTDISSARSSVNTAITGILNSEERINELNVALNLAEDQLRLAEADATPEQIASQRALVDRAEATLSGYLAELSKRRLTSPINGTVTVQDAEVGEIVSAASTVVEIISASNFEIEVKIPEVDIANMQVGNLAEITLDTYGSDVVFNAHVKSIDPAATLIEGVPTYKTVLVFDEQDSRVRSGMTADVTIVTAVKEDVIAIPSRAVIRRNGSEIVRLFVNDSVQEVEVKTGIRGGLGLIEIISGVEEGDQVITAIREDS